MRIISLMLITIIVSIAVYSCTEDNPTIPHSDIVDSYDNIKKKRLMADLTAPNRTYIPGLRYCVYPATDCFPDVIVYPGEGVYYQELDNHITNYTVNAFFAENGNYVEISMFQNLNSDVINDLKDSVTTMLKVDDPESDAYTYRLIFTQQSGTPDYTN